ncbi:class I SAM-dependent methyltransferase [Saccharothrix violaceirubra]|nr:class I SAM-dependent methyltransferase [Saccharothrix violaceirubra]
MGQSGNGPGAIAPDGSPVGFFARSPARREPEVVHRAVAEGAAILELGCGAGRVTHPLLALGHPVVGVDESPEMLAHVRTEVVCAPIEELRLDRRFDAVVLGSFLINSAGPALGRRFLDTARAHVRDDGVVLVERAVPSHGDSDGGEVSVGEIRRVGDDLIVATLEYRLDGQVWTHRITNHLLDDDALAACLRAADLELESFLTEDRSWVRARPV